MFDPDSKPEQPGWRRTLYEVIYETETPAGHAFDLVLLVLIVLSIGCVALETVETLSDQAWMALRVAEWVFTVIFTVEYLLRVIVVERKRSYILSFYGIVDLLSTAPTYLSLFLEGGASLASLRALRLARVFRVFKLGKFLREGDQLAAALRASRYKISVFLAVVVTMVLILGTAMYVIEGPPNGFSSIPKSVYWAIVTLTTVGYGDIAPQTSLGQFVAAVIMLLGYGIIAVPTGVVTVELARAGDAATGQGPADSLEERVARVCQRCALMVQDGNANYCQRCGAELPALDKIIGSQQFISGRYEADDDGDGVPDQPFVSYFDAPKGEERQAPETSGPDTEPEPVPEPDPEPNPEPDHEPASPSEPEPESPPKPRED